MQGWEFALSLYLSFALVTLYKRAMGANCSLQKEWWEQIALGNFKVKRCGSKSLLSLLRKEQSDRIAPVAHFKRATVSDLLFTESALLFRSFAHKKWSIRLKNQRVNSIVLIFTSPHPNICVNKTGAEILEWVRKSHFLLFFQETSFEQIVIYGPSIFINLVTQWYHKNKRKSVDYNDP